MFCSKCGAQIDNSNKFCGVCGNSVDLIPPMQQINYQTNQNIGNNQLQYNYQNSYQNMNSTDQDYQYNQRISNNNLNTNLNTMYNTNYNQQQYNNNFNQQQYNQYYNVIDDNVLIDAYIGNNSDKLTNGSFSLCTFFFGYIYVMYRKMWVLGFLWLVAIVISTLFLGDIATLITKALNIYFAIKFKEMYLKHVKEEIHLIKMNNQGKSQNELVSICSKKGGTTVIPVVIYLCIYVLLFILAVIMIVVGYNEVEDNINNNYNNRYDYNDFSTNIYEVDL